MASVAMTRRSALPTHLEALAMDEFPQAVGTLKALECESGRAGLHDSHFTCSKIVEDVNEEGDLDEDRAQRSFQQSLERLRRCTRAGRWLGYKDFTCITSVDFSDSDLA